MTTGGGWGLRLLLGSVALVGCSDDPFGVIDERALAAAQARWEAADLLDYQVEFHQSCFCPHPQDFTRLVIRDGQVVSAESLDSVPISGIPLTAWLTVPAAFDLIANAAKQDVYTDIKATYDPTLGYPHRIELICRTDVADCGAIYEFRNLEALPSGP
jgi:hypothetical protein